MKRKLVLALMLVLMLLMLVPWQALAQETVDTSVSALQQSFERKSFSAHDLEWVFYLKSNNIYYKTGTITGNTTTWSAASASVAACTDFERFSIYFDGTYVHYGRASGTTDNIYYRRGLPDDTGLITWTSSEVNVHINDANMVTRTISIATNTSGYPFISYYYNNGGGTLGNALIKGTANDGTFGSIDGGFEFFAGMHSGEGHIVVPLTSNKIAWFLCPTSDYLHARYWDGTWHSVVASTTSLPANSKYFSAVAQDDDVDIVFLEATSYDIVSTSYSVSTHSFGGETTLYAGATSTSAPVITRDSANNLHVFWENDPTDDHMYYAMYNYDESTWYSYYNLVDEIDDLPATGYYLNSDYTCDRENLGVYYIADTTILKFKLVDEPFIVDTLTPSPLGNTYATLRGEIMSLGFGSANETGFWFNTSPTLVGATQEGNVTGTFNVGVFTHGITGLLAAHTYWYIAYASGNYGTSYGNWTSFYTTSPPAPTPPAGNVTGDSATICGTTVWNFLAQPVTNTDIKLTWDWWPVSGNSSTQIAIYYGLYYYPINLANGTLIYQGTGDAYTHTNLSPGTTYYYRAWLLCGGNYSADYVQDWATTYGSSPVVSPPEQPEGWFQDPSCTAYSKIPLLSDALVAVTTAYGFPATTVCVMFTLLWIIVLGLAVFLFIHSAMMMIITIAVLIILASIMGLLPLWMIVIAICLGGISIYISGRT